MPEFGPEDPEYCPAPFTKSGEPNTEHAHCPHWDDCEPCCRCGDDAVPEPNPDGSPGCDCPKHNPDLYDEQGKLK